MYKKLPAGPLPGIYSSGLPEAPVRRDEFGDLWLPDQRLELLDQLLRRLLPAQQVNRTTIYRWRTKGKHGLVLPHVIYRHRVYSTGQAVLAWLEACQQAA